MIRILTDSTADFPAEEAAALGACMNPLLDPAGSRVPEVVTGPKLGQVPAAGTFGIAPLVAVPNNGNGQSVEGGHVTPPRRDAGPGWELRCSFDPGTLSGP